MSYVKRGWKLSVKTIPEDTQTLNLLNKNVKCAILNIFKELKEIISKELKEVMRVMYHRIENINIYY